MQYYKTFKNFGSAMAFYKSKLGQYVKFHRASAHYYYVYWGY